LVITSENGVDRFRNINGSICAKNYKESITQRTKKTATMSNHYGNSLTAVSPQSNSPYLVPKFEKENHRRNRGFTSHNTNSNLNKNAAIPVTPRGERITIPATVTPNQRRASFTSPYIATPQSFDFESLTIEEPKSPHGVRTTRTLSVIGLPSEYPVYQRDESVVSSFASSVASSLLMEELDDFEEFFGDDSVPKVFDSYSCSSTESPPKSDMSHPPRPPVSTSPLRARTLSSDTPMESFLSSPPLQKPNNMKTRRVSDSSVNSRDSLGSKSSRSRRRRNYGMNENDFEKLTDEFSTLTVQ
jgi:hypothetical protein